MQWAEWIAKKHAAKEKLVNKDHYQELKARLSLIKNPTVESAIYVMRYQGNGDYVDAFPEMRESCRQPHFPAGTKDEVVDFGHEVVHICAELGHTPFQENLRLPFETALNVGAKLRHASLDELDEFHRRYNSDKNACRETTVRLFQDKPAPEISRRDEAVYFAAGMYLRNKLDSYIAAKMHADTHSYEEREAFCNNFAKHDSEPALQLHSGLDWDILGKAPYPLILLSKEEWRAIEAVALGMSEPKETKYEQRLTPIKEALVHADLFFDRPKFVEELCERQRLGVEKQGRPCP